MKKKVTFFLSKQTWLSSTSVSHFFDMQGHYWYNTVCCYSITWSSQILYCSVPTSSFCKLWKWIKITKKSGKNNCFKQSFNKIKESSNFRSKVCKDISVQASWSCVFFSTSGVFHFCLLYSLPFLFVVSNCISMLKGNLLLLILWLWLCNQYKVSYSGKIVLT